MLSLKPIGTETFRAWREDAIKDYAKDKIAAGTWAAESAYELSDKEFTRLLPDGPATPNNHIWSMHDDSVGKDVGVLWIAILEHGGIRMAFIYDIVVFEGYRRRGYGTQALSALEGEVRALGLDRIGLHVFGHNPGARALYEKVGYIITDINMVKTLG